MDVCCNSSSMDTNGYLATVIAGHNRRYLCKLQFLLCLCHGEYLLLPFVICLFADTVFFAPATESELDAILAKVLAGNKPTVEEVPDSEITDETWITCPVKIKKVGKIKVLGDSGLDGHPFNYGDKTAELYDWDWEWLEEKNDKA